MCRRRLAAPLALAVLVIAGCGGRERSTRLELELSNGSVGHARFTLRCDPPGGDLPRSARVCARLAAEPGALEHPQPFTCFGGLFSWWNVSVRGRFRGHEIDRQFSTCLTRQQRLIGQLGLRWLEITDRAQGIPPGTATWLKLVARREIASLSLVRPARASFRYGAQTQVVIRGPRLVCRRCSHPRGVPAPHGTEAVLTIDPRTHDPVSFSLHR